jgi:hypothetical protein
MYYSFLVSNVLSENQLTLVPNVSTSLASGAFTVHPLITARLGWHSKKSYTSSLSTDYRVLHLYVFE